MTFGGYITYRDIYYAKYYGKGGNLFVGGKNESQKRGGGEMNRMHNIYP